MLEKLAIAFGAPHHGWMAVDLRFGPARFHADASDVPADSVAPLVVAFAQLAAGGQDALVTLYEEPYECEMHFRGDGTQVILEITRYPDRRRTDGWGEVVFTSHGSRRAVCLTFWRALRRLESEVTTQDWERGWKHPFPSAKLADLTETIRKLRDLEA